METFANQLINSVTVALFAGFILGVWAMLYEVWERGIIARISGVITFCGLSLLMYCAIVNPAKIYLVLPFPASGGVMWIWDTVIYHRRLSKQPQSISFSLPKTGLFTAAGRFTIVFSIIALLMAFVDKNASEIVNTQKQLIKAEKEKKQAFQELQTKLSFSKDTTVIIKVVDTAYKPKPVYLKKNIKTKDVINSSYGRNRALELLDLSRYDADSLDL